MAMIIGEAKDVVEIMRLMNSGNTGEALKKVGLNGSAAAEFDNGDLIDKVVTVANKVNNNTVHSAGVLVSPSAKKSTLADATQTAAELNRAVAADVVTEATNYILAEAGLNDTLKAMGRSAKEQVGGVAGGVKEGFRRVGDVVDDAAGTGVGGPNSYTRRTGAVDPNDPTYLSHGDVNAARRKMLGAAGATVAGGGYALGTALGDYPAPGEIIDKVADANKDSTGSFNPNSPLGLGGPSGNGTGEVPNRNLGFSVGGNSPVGGPNSDGNSASVAAKEKAEQDAITAAATQSQQNREAAANAGGVLDRIKNSITAAMSGVPKMLENAQAYLTNAIQGKKQYIALVGMALVGSFILYGVFKLYKWFVARKGEEVSAAKANIVDVPEEVNESYYTFIGVTDTYATTGAVVHSLAEGLFGFGDSDEDSSAKKGLISRYITSAVDAAHVMFNDPGFKTSKLYPYAERGLANVACLYDEVSQDINELA